MDYYDLVFDKIILSSGVACCTFGILLLFFKVASTPEFLPYRKAKNCLIVLFFLMGVNLFTWLTVTDTEKWEPINPLRDSYDFMFFYLEGIFYCYAFLCLVDPHFLKKEHVVRDTIGFALSSFFIHLANYPVLPGIPGVVFATLAVLVFVAQAGLLIRRFLIVYAQKKRELGDYFTEDMSKFMVWIKKSLFCVIAMGMMCYVIVTMGFYLNCFFQLLILSMNFYIAIKFMNYAHLFHRLNYAVVTDKEVEEAQAAEEKESLVQNYEHMFGDLLSKWLDDKKYLSPQLTIDDLSMEMGTNKLYMSRYINHKFHENFSSWITRLRLEEAKAYVKSNPSLRQEDVALHCGFSSSSYFSKVFSKQEGMSPAAWRKENIK